MIVTVASDRNRQVRRQCLLLTKQNNVTLCGSMPGCYMRNSSRFGVRKKARRGVPRAKTRIKTFWTTQQHEDRVYSPYRCIVQGIAHQSCNWCMGLWCCFGVASTYILAYTIGAVRPQPVEWHCPPS